MVRLAGKLPREREFPVGQEKICHVNNIFHDANGVYYKLECLITKALYKIRYNFSTFCSNALEALWRVK